MIPVLAEQEIQVIQQRRQERLAGAERGRLIRSLAESPADLGRCHLLRAWTALGAAVRGFARAESARPAADPVPAPPNAPVGRHPHPTLACIERALGGPAGALTGAPDADRLEARALALTAEYWGEAVWTTGVVSAVAFRRALADLLDAVPSDSAEQRPASPVVELAGESGLGSAAA